ncbi:MAG: VPS10 domain-containing protein [Bacteroidia bacterium]
MKNFLFPLVACLIINASLNAQKNKSAADSKIDYSTVNQLSFRSIGPAVTSGRVSDIAVDPLNASTWYIAAASGGIWKTTNSGTTFSPIFDQYGSYSIGCIAIDPNNHNVIWAGTGENNNQRSVSYGDGIYRSDDGGASWKNMGLKNSEHIGQIIIDPRNSDVIFVAAYGPLWSDGGDRGIYKTTDGGKTWNSVLTVSKYTGFNEVCFHPKNPDILYAAAHQRRRHEWTYISGGPESALYRSVDAGKTWEKLTNGLPSAHMGRIGLATTVADPDRIYAIVESDSENKGVYLSTNRGASWKKQSSWATAGNYYQEIKAHPVNPNILYSLDTWAMVSDDAGKSFSKLGERNKHVDNHALYIDPKNPQYLLMGCDGGLYESYDHGQNWKYFANLPITQFYRVCADRQSPYWVYAGTQDNNTLGGPSATTSASGILNSDWFVTVGGDGFESQVDPEDPNTVYSQWQYGGLVRHDRKTGESYDIKPVETLNDSAFRWNWDAPLLISPHNAKRLYFGANVLFRSDDRGNTWKRISPDLSRQLDRNALPVMDRIWSVDAVAKNQSTSIYGNLTAISESPRKEGLLMLGTDDGLIQISMNGGTDWTKTERISGIPERVLVHAVCASRHDEKRMYAVFNNHRNGDFKPYICISEDQGKTWKIIVNGLPERGSVYCLAEDPKQSGLIYAGTEFGLFFSTDMGQNWNSLKAGLPVICIRDIEIQDAADDLILASFGRGIYILDNLQWMRDLAKLSETNAPESAQATFLEIRPYKLRTLATPLGHKGKSFQGAAFYTAENPLEGLHINWYLHRDYKTIRELRKERESELINKGKNTPYPTRDSLILEGQQKATYQLMQITDKNGNLIRIQQFPAKKGLHQFSWDGKLNSSAAVSFRSPDPENPYDGPDAAAPAAPGKYYVQIVLFDGANTIALSDKQEIELLGSGLADERFNAEVSEIRKVISGMDSYINNASEKLQYYRAAIAGKPVDYSDIINRCGRLENTISNLRVKMYGNSQLAQFEFETKPGIASRIDGIVYNLWSTTQAPSNTYREQLKLVTDDLEPIYAACTELEKEIKELDALLNDLRAPATPGRLPIWKK